MSEGKVVTVVAVGYAVVVTPNGLMQYTRQIRTLGRWNAAAARVDGRTPGYCYEGFARAVRS